MTEEKEYLFKENIYKYLNCKKGDSDEIDNMNHGGINIDFIFADIIDEDNLKETLKTNPNNIFIIYNEFAQTHGEHFVVYEDNKNCHPDYYDATFAR